MGKSLLDKIESEALGGDIVKALRLCIKLRHSRSAELKKWASLELHGYDAENEVPGYRRINAPLCVDGLTRTAMFTGQQISTFELPDFARDTISEDVVLPYPIPELQEMVLSAERKDQPVKLGPPGGAMVVTGMNQSGRHQANFNALYWQVATVSLKGVIERVRTDLIALVSEVRSGMETGQDLPSPDIASENPDKKPTRGKLEVAGWIAGIVSAVVGVIFLLVQLLG